MNRDTFALRYIRERMESITDDEVKTFLLDLVEREFNGQPVKVAPPAPVQQAPKTSSIPDINQPPKPRIIDAVFEAVKHLKRATTAEVAEHLGKNMQEAGAHLSLLLKNGRIVVVEKRPQVRGFGAPANVYGLPDEPAAAPVEPEVQTEDKPFRNGHQVLLEAGSAH